MNDKHEIDANAATGWDGKAKARVSYAIADLGSAIAAFFPGYGTAISAGTGLYSTFGNFNILSFNLFTFFTIRLT